MRIVILGPPGSGKGTQARLFAAEYGVPHIMASELLRGDNAGTAAAHENPLVEFATRRLRRKDTARGFIIDGFPRTIQHVLVLDEILAAIGKPLQLALRIDIDADAMIQRLAGRRRCRECGHTFNIFVTPTRLEEQCDLCGGSLHRRVDDTEEVIDNRLRVYENLSTPVVAFYRANGLLRDIPGDAPVETVRASIARAVKEQAMKRRKPATGAATAGQGTSRKDPPKKSAPKKAAPKKAAPTKAAPKQAAPKKAAPKKAAPKKAAPKKAAPKKAAPKKAAPKKATPKKAAGKPPVRPVAKR